MAPYCAYIATPNTFSPSINLTGHAVYEYRIDGNGIIPDGTNAYAPNVPANQATTNFGLTVNGTAISYNCTSPCTTLKAVKGLADAFSANIPSSLSVLYNMTAIAPYRISGSGAVTLSAPVNMTALNARPIRYAEVQITNDAGAIIQCAETDANGDFTVAIPGDGSHYNVNVLSRSSNSSNTAYVMTTPTANTPYKITTGVTSTVNTSVNLRAPATGSLEGGAFNILDQIANAQAYLRTKTASCDSSMAGTYFAGCVPVTTIPLVYTYWSPGVTPGVYFGSTGPISYYLNGKRELYILGGVGGDTKVTDMDHFDNSVIVHEYGHFIEDQFGKPDSPGGSHNGNGIIDPRLAWGEGWANYFQAAVSGIPVYRDTTGYVCSVGTSGCSTGVSFKEPLETGTQFTMHDLASLSGEGTFHEFSISRILWAISKVSGVSQFSEIWTAVNGTSGMRVVSDSFKTISRLHVIHSGISGATDWSTVQTTEKQAADFSAYATPISIAAGCTVATSNPMSVVVVGTDDGSFASSNQFSNNDFYIFHHTGGYLPVSISWSGAGSVDLDLYIYKVGYTFGSSSSIVAMDNAGVSGTTGTASVNPYLGAGDYMINVMAYTGSYQFTGTYSTSYTMTVLNHAACPSAL